MFIIIMICAENMLMKIMGENLASIWRLKRNATKD